VRALTEAQVDARERAFIRDPANNCRLKSPPRSDQPSWAAALYLDHAPNYICDKSWKDPSWTTVDVPGVTFEQAMNKAKELKPVSVYGMTASLAAAGSEPSPLSTTRSLWLGIILPVTLFFVSLGLLISFLSSIRHRLINGKSNSAPQYKTASLGTPTAPSDARSIESERPSHSQLVDLIRKGFGPDIPISRGSGTKEDPLVITDTVDYVAIEYAVAKFLMSGEEYKKQGQKLFDINDRKVDELTFATKPLGAEEWKWKRRFYFDITAGFNRIGKY
jgi:hypothetical protein